MPVVPRPAPAALTGGLSRVGVTAADSPAGALARWQAAYVLVAAGRYGRALAALEALLTGPAGVASAAHRLRASVWRQLGLYGRGEADGARAVELADEVGEAGPRAELLAAACAGRVADAVGRLQSGDTAAAEVLDGRLLAARRCLATLPPDVPQRWRHVVRLGWVAGEVAITRGDLAQADLRFSDARAAAAEAAAPRHVAKSALFLAAVAAARGASVAADGLADEAARGARRGGALPLLWPALLIRAEVTADLAAARTLQREAARVLHAQLEDLPDVIRADVVRQHPCRWLLEQHPAGG